MSRIGYIKDYRKEIDSDIWLMPPLYHRVWQWLKYSVNHTQGRQPNADGTFTIINPGELPTSYRQIARGVGYHEYGVWKEPGSKTIKNILDWLETQKMIKISRNSKGTLITLLQWENYQGDVDFGNSGETIGKQWGNAEGILYKNVKNDNNDNNNINGQNEVIDPVVSEEKPNAFFTTIKIDGKDRVNPNDASHPFNVFWHEYPRRVKRIDAERSFKRNVKDWETLKLIIIDIQKRLAAGMWTEQNKKYIPHPTTYLNNLQWEDETDDDKKNNELEFGVYT